MYPPFINKFTTFVKDKQIIMKNTLKFILFAMLLACATSSFGGNKPRKGFLYREGTQLMLDGKNINRYHSIQPNCPDADTITKYFPMKKLTVYSRCFPKAY